MEKIVLKTIIREDKGKGACKQLRKDGAIPAVVYKEGKDALSVQVNNKDLWHALHTDAGENAIITMEIEGGNKSSNKTVIVKEIQVDPINEKFVHIDFHEISLKDKLKVKVPVVLKGEAVGVKEDDGVLAQEMWEIEVECLPTEIPEHIVFHVDDLRIGDSIHVKDVEAIEGVEFLDDPEQMVVIVHPPTVEEEAEEEVAAEEGEEPEVIKKGKTEEEEGEAEEAAPSEGGSEE